MRTGLVPFFLTLYTERRGRVVSTSALYLEDPGFESRPEDQLS